MHSSLHKINTTSIVYVKEEVQITVGNYIRIIIKAPLSSVLMLSLARVHCCPVRMQPNIVREVTFSKEAGNPNFYGQCPGGGGSGDALDQVVRKDLSDKMTSE